MSFLGRTPHYLQQQLLSEQGGFWARLAGVRRIFDAAWGEAKGMTGAQVLYTF